MTIPANPAVDLTTLAQVKLLMGIDPSDTSQDDNLQTLITAASAYIASYVSRQLVSGPVSEVRDGSGSSVMMFAEWPVTAVSSVAMDGNPVPAATGFSDYGYRFTGTRLILNCGRFCRGVANVQINYTGGYNPIPQDLAEATAEMVIYKLKAMTKLGVVGAQSIDGQSVTFNAGQDFTASQLTLMKQYMQRIQVIGS